MLSDVFRLRSGGPGHRIPRCVSHQPEIQSPFSPVGQVNSSPISISTRDLRVILRESEENGGGVVVRLASDVPGPGGSTFIAAHSRLTQRHLNWFEQRNPASGTRPTYIDVVIAHEGTRAGRGPDPLGAAESVESSGKRHRRARAVSKEVVARADDVTRQAAEVYRIVGDSAFSPKALRNPQVAQNLAILDERIRQFHASVRTAIDEYLVGNTLIMDLISRHDLATRAVQHGLGVAVFATEIASQVLLKDIDEHGDGEWPGGDDEDAQLRLQRLRKDLAEIFLGGFMHDCGLWSAESPGESHETAGARLLWNIPEIQQFLPALTKILLFHSDVIRIAAKPVLVQIVEHADDPARTSFRSEFYRSADDARTSLRFRGDNEYAEILGESDMHKVLPVALAEYCITQAEGFNARSLPEIVSRLAGHAQAGLYLRYIVALCNAQVEIIAPRRAYVALRGCLLFGGRRVDVDGFEGGSLWHTHDMYSPHVVALFSSGTGEKKTRLTFASPHDEAFWRPTHDTSRRFYLAAGRHRNSLVLRVTGFMSEDVYTNILGEYELELKRVQS